MKRRPIPFNEGFVNFVKLLETQQMFVLISMGIYLSKDIFSFFKINYSRYKNKSLSVYHKTILTLKMIVTFKEKKINFFVFLIFI